MRRRRSSGDGGGIIQWAFFAKSVVVLVVLLSLFFKDVQCSYSVMEQEKQPTGKLFISEECAPKSKSNKKISVDEIRLVCASSEYDDEGQLYTNSPTCRPYDVASLRIDFRVVRYPSSQNVTVFLEIDAGFFKRFEVIQSSTNMCNFGSLEYLDASNNNNRNQYDDDDSYENSQSVCPMQNGPYSFSSSFVVPDYNPNDSEGMEFTPDLHLRFRDESLGAIGCVETGSLAMIAEGNAKRRRGQRLFMLSVLCLTIISTTCFVVYRRRRVAKEFIANRKRRSRMRRIRYIHSASMSSGVLMTDITPSESGSSSAATPLHDGIPIPVIQSSTSASAHTRPHSTGG